MGGFIFNIQSMLQMVGVIYRGTMGGVESFDPQLETQI
jgi:hypothetical protein